VQQIIVPCCMGRLLALLASMKKPENFGTDKHSSLLRRSIKDEGKKVYYVDTRLKFVFPVESFQKFVLQVL